MTNVDPLVSDLAARLDTWRSEEAALVARLTTLRETIQSAQKLLQSLVRKPPPGPVSVACNGHDMVPQELLPAELEALRGLSQMEVMRQLAEMRGGILRASEAKAVLIKLGSATGASKNLNSQIHSMLRKSRDFDWKAPGIFHLKSSAQQPMLRLPGVVSNVEE